MKGVTIRNPLEGDWLDGIAIMGCSDVRVEGKSSVNHVASPLCPVPVVIK